MKNIYIYFHTTKVKEYSTLGASSFSSLLFFFGFGLGKTNFWYVNANSRYISISVLIDNSLLYALQYHHPLRGNAQWRVNIIPDRCGLEYISCITCTQSITANWGQIIVTKELIETMRIKHIPRSKPIMLSTFKSH